MKIYNVRLGPACNSSSTHSLLLLKPEHVGKLKDSDKGDGSFGWDWFTAVSRRSKLDYLSAALFGALKEDVGVETACAVVRDWLGRDILDRDISDETLSEYYIDHQSQWCMPRGWDGKGVDRQFVEDMKTFLLRDDVAVLGGNDNVSPGVNHPDEGPDFTFDGHKHLDKGDVVNVPLPLDGGPDGGKSLRCRKDPKGFWTIFNKVGGSKIRFSFESLAADVVEKSTHPELVDVKVTDYCEENCPYCYQGSTTKGAHADKNYVNALLVTFGELRVFEVAFGGGEPLLWPGLQSALNVSRYYGVQGNFTTRQTDWLEDPQRRKDILGTGDSMSAVAFSVDNAQAVARIAELIKPVIGTGGWRGDVMRESHFSIQVVVGAMGTDEFEKIAVAAKEAKLPLTLLGFKDTGRGGAFKKKRLTTPDWAGVLKRTGYYSIRVDTAFIRQFQDDLDGMELAKRLGSGYGIFYSKLEGAHSMYVDAVRRMAGPSSYCDPGKMAPIEYTNSDAMGEEISKIFAAMEPE